MSLFGKKDPSEEPQVAGLGETLAQTLMGNMSEACTEDLTSVYGNYLMEGETIVMGFKLIRYALVFTNRRMIEFDRQGATGIKYSVNSIFLSSIIRVSAETSGFGVDDSEIRFDYITSPYHKAKGGVETSEKRFEFPKKYDVQKLYKFLMEIVFENTERLSR